MGRKWFAWASGRTIKISLNGSSVGSKQKRLPVPLLRDNRSAFSASSRMFILKTMDHSFFLCDQRSGTESASFQRGDLLRAVTLLFFPSKFVPKLSSTEDRIYPVNTYAQGPLSWAYICLVLLTYIAHSFFDRLNS